MNGMIQVGYDGVQTLLSNTDTVKYNDVTLRTQTANCFNGWLGYNEGDSQFHIVVGGIYEITFNANVSSGVVGEVALGLFADNIQLSEAEMDTTIGTANEWSNISMNRKIRVCSKGNVTLSIRSVPTVLVDGVATTTEVPILKNVNLSIERLA